MNMDILFAPFNLRGHTLRNRIVMAPLTRDRALPGKDAPQPLNAEYYGQRADAGMIIAEATQISPVSPAGGVFDSAPEAVFFPLVRELSQRQLAYVHVIEGATQGPRDVREFDFKALRKEFNGP